MTDTLGGYPLAVRRVTAAGREWELFGPANYETLIDDPRVVQRFERDEYMPYWAEFWPVSVLLAELVAHWPPANKHTVLELGCGLGLVSLVAAWRGHSVTASDYEPDALAFVEHNARHNGLPVPELRTIDWRERYPQRYERIVACEVLYETRSLRPIAEFITCHLAPGGEATILDSYRQTADAFEAIARHCELAVEQRDVGTVPETPGRAAAGERPTRGRAFVLTHKE